jgi:hypothetical protein
MTKNYHATPYLVDMFGLEMFMSGYTVKSALTPSFNEKPPDEDKGLESYISSDLQITVLNIRPPQDHLQNI